MKQPPVRPGILNLKPYVAGESAIEGHATVIKLSSNEGALGTSPKAIAAVRQATGELFRYPDGGAVALRAAIAKRYGLDADRLVCGAGSDELISLLVRAYAGPGDEVLFPEHAFLMYRIYAQGVGATPVAAPENGLIADVDALLAHVTDNTRILFLANPNNPTGTYLTISEVRRLREGLREDVLLVLDAAYAEYVDKNDYEPGVALVDSHPNTVMLRTFSKIHGMGGARLGWAYAPAHVVDILNRLRSPFNVSLTALAAGAASMGDIAFQDLARQHNDYWLAWTTERLRALGYDLTDSVGNFVLVTFPTEPGRTAADADAALRAKGIIVRGMAGYGLPNSLRITIGTGDEMQACVDALTEFITA
ncbi:histidinol-phosphate transaminase [Roseospira marina]|uniref:Histidinol-phosphate aminotransferase n=1 Tax=Roseospira marina TaxID=140057 RepID=A0A5M6IFJ2_9PROT|nr:histidinol-phosphate transaminase [Roseospira marina]KAA5606993.1 histidinol-phosphate transaminase [Roseospira marina]MBB4312825.1 histidinol-phosphate aminotransferase [Roseospira marina]MBB5086402.1 histidinol-phosphate aminotransferase [Roseospira marina]